MAGGMLYSPWKKREAKCEMNALSVTGATFGVLKANLGLRGFIVGTGFGAVMG